MRFSFAESMTDPSYYLPLARAAEAAGYDSMVVPDSICYPEVSDTTYPFNPDGTREFLEDKPFLEPFSIIPAMGAVTERLRFVTFVIKLPIRQPVLVSKQVSSTAVLTNNRLLLGVGTSPWPEDYEICGVPWERRGTRMDEEIAIIRGLMAGGFFEFHGKVFDVPSIKMCPTPSRPVPILIGGHHEAALKRAAVDGDGWLHGGGDPADLPGLLARLAELRKEHGTESKPFETHVISLDAYTPDGVQRLEELGVTDVIVGFRWPYGAGAGHRVPADEDRQPRTASPTTSSPRSAEDEKDGRPHMTDEPLDARELGIRSRAAVAAKDREAWLALFTDDAIVADPIGPSPLDPEGKGHHGRAAIAAFYDNVIATAEAIEFEFTASYLSGDEVAEVGIIRTTLAGGTHQGVVRGVYTYRSDGAGRIAALRTYWEFDKLELVEVGS